MSHRIVWVDLPVTDLDRAIGFYSAVLGLTVTKEGGPGFSFGLLPHGEGAVVLDSEGNRVALHATAL